MPIISAVGHQTDVTIADFVADHRAATPSAAGEMVVPVYQDLARILDGYHSRMEKSILGKLAQAEQRLAYAANAAPFRHPERMLRQESQGLDQLWLALTSGLKQRMTAYDNSLAILAEKMDMLSPLTTLSRGYAICRSLDEAKVITGVEQAALGQEIEVVLARGRLNCRVTRKTEGAAW